MKTVRLRLLDGNDELEIVPVNITHVCEDIDAISLEDRIIGYIRQVDRIFVALTGARLDRAEECGQSQLWDKAVTRLLQETDAAAPAATQSPFSQPPVTQPSSLSCRGAGLHAEHGGLSASLQPQFAQHA